ncbi:hypothetical protein SAMN05443287_10418 [Micromonospora phaseoli]|uniref:Uncharacterized protein n=1 Tax=Micromonospora phaseoli TaxID=1144548 RepID=A0A1H6YDS8_9ACTN|nr:hypothetical protein [Micromonospora phaseoli]PZV99990.1 hypothetical protein CLV64_10317 [Micromonospora phaseoli]GIJ81190.1 hypothetical protein Xph01_56220 [Micromonospora phaseoli]SEJ35340.1 hypothetical protein SAMN05443287_10418 [Micromonospora phaseoli]
MTQPDDATEALPTQRVPAEPAVNVPPGHTPSPDAPADAPTVSLGGAEPTVSLGGAEPTAFLGGAEPTVFLEGAEPTVSLGRIGPTQAVGVTAALGATEAGRTTAATAGAHTGGEALAAPTAGPGGELRFGPGVPVAPPPAPAWPTPAPPPRRRSAWRRLVSLLSTLLTLALLAAVGLWIWQRLSPLEVVEVNAAVPRPAGERCDVSIDVVATVRTNGRAGVIEYQWLRSGSAPGALLTERVGWGQRTVELTLRWSFSGVGSTTETATVNIVAPSPVQAATEVSYACPR